MNHEIFTTWLKVSHKYTRVTRQRNFIPKQNEEEEKAKLIFVMIPGNPGNDKSYDRFGEQIFEEMAQKVFHIPTEFYSIAYLNHVELPNHLRNEESDITTHDDIYLLNDQTDHKFNFFMEYMPKNIPIILIGHSIGAYIVLKILPKLVENGFNIVKVIGLFPAVEELASSPNGVKFGGIFKFINKHSTLTKISLSWLWLLPDRLKRFIVRLDLRDPQTPECVIQSAMENISSLVIRNMLNLLINQLQILKLHDDSLFLEEFRDRIILFYGATDKWIPKELAEKQAERLGKSCVFFDDKNGCDHAFVNCDGEVMAKIVVSFVENFLKEFV